MAWLAGTLLLGTGGVQRSALAPQGQRSRTWSPSSNVPTSSTSPYPGFSVALSSLTLPALSSQSPHQALLAILPSCHLTCQNESVSCLSYILSSSRVRTIFHASLWCHVTLRSFLMIYYSVNVCKVDPRVIQFQHQIRRTGSGTLRDFNLHNALFFWSWLPESCVGREWVPIPAMFVGDGNDNAHANVCSQELNDLNVNLMQKAAVSHVNVFKKFCKSCLCMNFYKLWVPYHALPLYLSNEYLLISFRPVGPDSTQESRK